MTYTLSNGAANAAIDAVVDSLDGGSPGTIKIYDGTKPATADTAVTTQTLLATVTLANPAFGSAASRSASLNDPAAVTAVATGTASWFRAANSAGTAKFDGTVGTSGSDLNMSSTSIVSGGSVDITGGTFSYPA